MQSASAIAQKWASRMQAAGEAMKNGVNAVTVNPAQLAIQAKDRWVQGIQRAAADGRYEQGLSNVSLQDWKNAMLNKGVSNMQTGAREGTSKVQSFLGQFLPHLQTIQGELAGMPRGTLEDNIQRMLHQVRRAAEFRKS